jgi:hypothetical protein
MTKSRAEASAILVVFLIALLGNLVVASIGWSHAISDAYGWRQAETAIRAYFIQQGGAWFSYETPVLGPPWPLPHEFPVYQLLTAAVTNATGLQLEQAGRAVSLALFYGTLGVTYLLLAELAIARTHRLLVLAFWLVSPLYLFWSRTFMIESTALFLSVTFLTFTIRLVARGRPMDAAVALIAGGLAFAVKPPTLMTFVALAGVFWLVQLRRGGYRVTVTMVVAAAVIVLPIPAGRMWHEHADALKMLNPFGWGWTSDAMWRDWVLGPPGTNARLSVRFEPSSWAVLWIRTIPESVGHFAVAAAALLGVLVAGRRRLQFALAIAAFVFHFVAFTPLHLSHAYYQYAMGVFLVVAVGIAAVGLLETGDGRRQLAWVLTALVAVCEIGTYVDRMLPQQQRNAYRKPAWYVRLATELSSRTRPDDVIVAFGMNWNPEVPYYARRRALMWPGWADPSPEGSDVANAVAKLTGYRIGAVVSCSRSLPDAVLERFRALGGISAADPWTMSARTTDDGNFGQCTVYFRRAG